MYRSQEIHHNAGNTPEFRKNLLYYYISLLSVKFRFCAFVSCGLKRQQLLSFDLLRW